MNSTQNELVNTISYVDVEAFTKIMDENPDLNLDFIRYEVQTPLIVAIRRKNITMVRRLLDAGADPNFKAGYGPLITAVLNDQLEIARLLISKKADITVTDKHGSSLAKMVRSEEMMDFLVENGLEREEPAQNSLACLFSRLVEIQNQTGHMVTSINLPGKPKDEPSGRSINLPRESKNEPSGITFDDGTFWPVGIN